MQIIPVKHQGAHAYDIRIDEEDLWEGLSLSAIRNRRVMIVTDEKVAPLYADSLRERLAKEASEVHTVIIPSGESHKTTEQILPIYRALINARFDRNDFLVALGGGVTGDMTGFAAATYLRGISFIQIPTTLLAQTDSSIGGKTGVDFEGYKNMIGAFHMPSEVYIHPAVLKSLPDRELSAGMAEVIKHGLIRDAAYFNGLFSWYDAVFRRDVPVLTRIIRESCSIKGGVVERDPHEKGERTLLNFGHTIGHAIEKAYHFRMLHGECVAIGCVCAAYLSEARGLLDMQDVGQIRELFRLYHLPDHASDLPDNEEILRLIKSDKKMNAGTIRFVLLRRIGEAFTDDTVTDEEIAEALDRVRTKDGAP